MQGPRHVMRGCGMASEWPMVAWSMGCHSVIRLGAGLGDGGICFMGI